MTESEAELLAVVVREVTGFEAAIQPDDGWFSVEVTKRAEDHGDDIYTLRDEADWQWLKTRIGSRSD